MRGGAEDLVEDVVLGDTLGTAGDHPDARPGEQLRQALAGYDGDEGARRLIDPAKLISIETDDAGILRDVDTPADLAR